MDKFPKIIMNIIPLSSTEFSMPDNFNVLSTQPIFPLCHSGSSNTYVADGFLSHSSNGEGQSTGYVLIFRNGSIEAVSSFNSRYDKNTSIPITFLENEILKKMPSYLEILRKLKIEPPIYLFSSFNGR